MSAYESPKLDSATIARVADLRSRGRSWDFVAADIGCRAIDLTGACYDDPRYDKSLARAKREHRDERLVEACTRLQMEVRDPSDPKRAVEAAKALAEIVAQEESLEVKERIEQKKCDTRLDLVRLRDRRNAEREALAAKLEIENLRCETRLKVEELRAAARGLKAEKPDPADRPPTAAEEAQHVEAFWRGRERDLQGALEPGAEVYVWGGQHPLTEGLPPDDTDTRVLVLGDGNVRGRRIYWVITCPQSMGVSEPGWTMTPPAVHAPTAAGALQDGPEPLRQEDRAGEPADHDRAEDRERAGHAPPTGAGGGGAVEDRPLDEGDVLGIGPVQHVEDVADDRDHADHRVHGQVEQHPHHDDGGHAELVGRAEDIRADRGGTQVAHTRDRPQNGVRPDLEVGVG